MTPYELWQLDRYGNILYSEQPSTEEYDERYWLYREQEAERINDYHELNQLKDEQ